jgi:hypothetical protein
MSYHGPWSTGPLTSTGDPHENHTNRMTEHCMCLVRTTGPRSHGAHGPKRSPTGRGLRLADPQFRTDPLLGRVVGHHWWRIVAVAVGL